MFEASVNGEPYDPARWGAYFTPPGMARTGGNDDNKPAASTTEAAPAASTTEAAPAASTTTTDAPVETTNSAPVEEPVTETAVQEEVDTVNEAAADAGDDKDAKTQRILNMIRNRQQ